MKYLVSMEFVHAGSTPEPPAPEKAIAHVEQCVLPSWKALIGLREAGKVLAGGAVSGCEHAIFIAEADSPAELDRMLLALPWWPVLKKSVLPLIDFEERLTHATEVARSLKALQSRHSASPQ